METIKIASKFFRIPGEGVHQYEIEAVKSDETYGKKVDLIVDARDRTQAAKRCKAHGFRVLSVNMVA